MTVFLEKLRQICTSCPDQLAGWTDSGREFEVRDSDQFEKYLKNYFKGTLKTFVRQLHFYGFSKAETANGAWTFSHKKFTKMNPEAVLMIPRKTSKFHTASFATKEEVQKLRAEVKELRNTLNKGIVGIKEQLAQLVACTGTQEVAHYFDNCKIPSMSQVNTNVNTNSRAITAGAGPGHNQIERTSPEVVPHGFKIKRAAPMGYSLNGLASMNAHINKRIKVDPNDALSPKKEATVDFTFDGYALPVTDLSFN